MTYVGHVAVPWDRARALAHAAPRPLDPRTVVLADAVGLTLAEGLCTAGPLPAFDTAAMDGYAVRGPGPYQLRGRIAAGAVWEGLLGSGDAVAISTGAAVPPDATAVLRLEDASLQGGVVTGLPPASGKHIRRAGEDAAVGAELAPAGSAVGPAMLGLAAACGRDDLQVVPRPRVGVVVTGDELAQRGVSGRGLVRDMLGPMLPPLVAQLGGEVTELRHVPDAPMGRLATALGRPEAQDTSVVVVTGSTSVGPSDQLRSFLAASGATWVVDTVACRPGHPQVLAGLGGGRWLVGLPGNPFAAFVAVHTLLAPLLAGLTGRPLPPLPLAELRGDVALPPPGQTRLIPVTWDAGVVRPIGGHQPAYLGGAALAAALAAVPADWQPGQPVPLVLIR